MTAPTCPVPATRTPTVAVASVVSSTVAVCAVAEVTVPTRPLPFSTVWSGVIPSARPASMVTASAKPGAAAITFAATIRYRPRPARASSCCSCADWALLSRASLSSNRSRTTSACSAVILAWDEGPLPRSLKNEVTGRVTAPMALCAPPNTVPPNERRAPTGPAPRRGRRR